MCTAEQCVSYTKAIFIPTAKFSVNENDAGFHVIPTRELNYNFQVKKLAPLNQPIEKITQSPNADALTHRTNYHVVSCRRNSRSNG